MPRGGPRPGAGGKQLYRYVIKGVQYDTLGDAVKKLGVTKSAISKWCKDDGRDDCFKESVKNKANNQTYNQTENKISIPKVEKERKVKTKKEKKEEKINPIRKAKKIKQPQSQPQPQPQDIVIINEPPELDGDSTLAEINDAAKVANMTPLDFFLSIMKNVDEDKDLRIKVAYFAAPYIHPRAVDKKGKKEDQEDRAAAAAKGKFRAGKPPLSLVKATK